MTNASARRGADLRARLRDGTKAVVQAVSRNAFRFRYAPGDRLYLTFDDGPHPEHTPNVLQLLDAAAAKATFFLVGRNAARHPDLVRDLVARGHAVGLHTDSHRTLDTMTRDEFRSEIAANQAAIEAAVGVRPALLRPPLGRITPSSYAWARQLGLEVVHFTVTSNDWKAASADEIVERMVAVPLRGGEILSFHDNNPHTTGALATLLPRYAQRGYRLDAIRPAARGAAGR